MMELNCQIRELQDDKILYVDAGLKGLLVDYVEKDRFSLGRIVEVKISNSSEKVFEGVIHIQMKAARSQAKFFMPGVIYNRNTADMPNSGRKKFPRIRLGGEACPESDYWMMRSDRLALPMSLVYGDKRVIGVAAAPYLIGNDRRKKEACLQEKNQEFYRFCGFTCRLHEDSVEVGYTLGYENAPWLFVQTATVLERSELDRKNCITLYPNETIHVSLYLYDYEADSETSIYKAMEDTYFRYHQNPRMVEGMNIHKATEMLSTAIRDYAWIPEDRAYTGFVYDREEGIAYNKIPSLTWTNGLSIGVPMLLAANRQKDETMREQAITLLEEIITGCMNPKSGLPFDSKQNGVWTVRGWWYDGMHSGGHSMYLTGQAIYYILKAYQNELVERGEKHSNWIAFVKPIVEKVNTLLNSDMEYPFSVSEKTGAALEYDSMGGVWCLAASVYFCLITGEKKLLSQLIASEKHYYETFVSKAECYGGPLDTDKAVDNEGILAYIRAVRLLHELTGDEIYLDHLYAGLCYEFSFKLGYNTPIQIKPLSEIGWSSCGGSITSVANPHIHPMSSTIVDEMYYYLDKRKDAYVENRLKDTLAWGMQTFNTYPKEYGYGFEGWMSERFCYCEGLVTEKYPDGTLASTWFALMPWASASIIEGFVGKAW